MSKIINGSRIAVFPWEEKPAGSDAYVWRYSKNPIISRHPLPKIARIFNSAVVPFKDGFVGVFRGDGENDIPHLYVGHSKDGIHFSFEKEMIHFVGEDGKSLPDTCFQYDPRIIPLEGRYYIVYCDDLGGPTISVAVTDDFVKFAKIPTPFLPYNRNGVLFPRKIDGKYVMLSRPSDSGHTAFGDIFLSESLDLRYWGNHRLLAQRGYEWWCALKIGPGPYPIETDKGWILFTHGVNRTCNGYVYSVGVMLLDKDDPSKVIRRGADYFLTPEEDYETIGFVPNVTFPTSALAHEDGRIAIYYGAADTHTGIAFTTVDDVLRFLEERGR